MGMYTDLQFKGIVKEEYRDIFERIAIHGEWSKSDVPLFRSFSEDVRASCIPMGNVIYDDEDFSLQYNKETGFWCFWCSLKNYNYTIEEFFRIVPEFIESVEAIFVHYEEWENWEEYDLIDNEIKLISEPGKFPLDY